MFRSLIKFSIIFSSIFLPEQARIRLENVLTSLSYHENKEIAQKAAGLLAQLFSGHKWTIENTEVIYLNQKVTLSDKDKSCICTDGKFSFVKNEFVPSKTGFYDICIGAFDENCLFQPIQKAKRLVCVRKDREIIHEVATFWQGREIDFEKLKRKIEKLKLKGVTAVHLPGIFDRTAF